MTSITKPENSKYPLWAYMPIKYLEHERINHLRAFMTLERRTNGSINSLDIIGSTSIECQGVSWVELLERGNNGTPVSREFTRRHRGLTFISINGFQWYIDASTDHRACLAKFTEASDKLHGVDMLEYRVDWVQWHAFHCIKRLTDQTGQRYQISVERKNLETMEQREYKEKIKAWNKDLGPLTLTQSEKPINHLELNHLEFSVRLKLIDKTTDDRCFIVDDPMKLYAWLAKPAFLRWSFRTQIPEGVHLETDENRYPDLLP